MTPHHTAPDTQELLRKAGLKATRNRVLVLEAIVESGTALTAREVFTAVSRRHALNRVTVYRILDLLADSGAVNRSTCGDRAHHFCVGGSHSHFHCIGCGVVSCIDNKTLHFDADRVSDALSVSVNHVNLLLEGVCEQCSAHGLPENKKN